MSTTGATPPAARQDRVREGLLRKAGLTAAQIEDVVKTERETGQQLDQILVGKNLLPEGKCMAFFADLLGLEFKASLDGVNVPPAFIHNIPVQFARTIATGSSDRQANMVAFALAALELLAEQLA
jgi:hypothetical protein